MIRPARVPLALLNLLHSKGRLAASVGGVAFAVVLMVVEMGFVYGLYDSQTHVVRGLNADLVLINKSKEAILPKLPFPRSRMIEARGFPGVAWGYPLYIESSRSRWKFFPPTPGDAGNPPWNERPLLVFGFDPDDPVFLDPKIAQQAALLKEPDTALIDVRSKPDFGRMTSGVSGELAGRRVRLVGTFSLGADFRVDGNMVVSDQTFFRCFPNQRTGDDPAGSVEFGLLKLMPGADRAAVQRSLARSMDGVAVLTRDEFEEQVGRYWAKTKPVGKVFGLGMFVGFLIGVTVCYQILYTSVLDNLRQYATLKAIGYANRYIVKVVLTEAFYLAVLGYVPGILCGIGIYTVMERVSGILMRVSADRLAFVFVLTLAMCLLAAGIAVRKVVRADPAEVY